MQDVDGYVSPEDMRGLVTLLLPDSIKKDEEAVRDLLDRMDRNKDGLIAYEEFVQTIRETGQSELIR